MYVHAYVAVTLRNVNDVMWVSGIHFLAGHLSSIYHEDGTRFSTLKVDGQACKTFRACRATAANVKPNSEQSIS